MKLDNKYLDELVQYTYHRGIQRTRPVTTFIGWGGFNTYNYLYSRTVYSSGSNISAAIWDGQTVYYGQFYMVWLPTYDSNNYPTNHYIDSLNVWNSNLANDSNIQIYTANNYILAAPYAAGSNGYWGSKAQQLISPELLFTHAQFICENNSFVNFVGHEITLK